MVDSKLQVFKNSPNWLLLAFQSTQNVNIARYACNVVNETFSVIFKHRVKIFLWRNSVHKKALLLNNDWPVPKLLFFQVFYVKELMVKHVCWDCFYHLFSREIMTGWAAIKNAMPKLFKGRLGRPPTLKLS